MFTRTKIVCTIGPAVNTLEKMVELIEAGMNVARLNLSHGSNEEHARNIAILKKAREKTDRPLAIMVDTKGPEVRLGMLAAEGISFQPKQRFTLVRKPSKAGDLEIDHPEVLPILTVGTRILFDDGYIIAKVIGTEDQRVVIEMQNSGCLKSRKKVNIPDLELPLPAMTQEDIEDLIFVCKENVDIIAASFIRNAHHVVSMKDFIREQGKPEILVIAKIETAAGVENFDSIIQVADGIMVARGDLGVELDLSLVPKLQKEMIRKCYVACKPVVTATQMLESMITNPRPTRAEVSDVANAIYDSTSSVMLSAETAAGKYPIETVQRMKSIVVQTENDFNYPLFFEQHSHRDYHDISSAVSLAAVKTAYSAKAKAIIVFTTSGGTARAISRFRPEMPIIAVTSNQKNYQQLAFNWGVIPVLCEDCKNGKEAFAAATRYGLAHGIISFGDTVVVTAGVPFGRKGTTNMMIVENIGEILVRGHPGVGSKVSGSIVFILNLEQVELDLSGQIVVIAKCNSSYLPLLQKAAGIILQNTGEDIVSEKYAIMIAKTYEIPLIVRADQAFTSLKEEEEVTLDPKKGIVFRGSDPSSTCPAFSFDGTIR